MNRLLYISTARAEMSEADLMILLQQSRVRNAALGVTGILVVGGKRFLQVLEGPDLAVARTYERIKGDPRHFAPVVLSNKTVSDRLFSEWAMGYQRGGPADEAHGQSELLQSLVAPIADPTVKAYFEQFVIRHIAA